MDIKDKEKLENKLVEIANKNLKLQSSYDVNDSVISGFETTRKSEPSTYVRKQIKERDNYTCVYCGRHLSNKDCEIDHVIPRAQGGNKKESNLVVSCRDCNLDKGYDKIVFNDLYQFYLNKTGRIIGDVKPDQLVKKIRNIGYPPYLTLFREVDTRGQKGNRFKYTNHTQIVGRNTKAKDNVKPWKNEYEKQLTAINDEQAKEIIDERVKLAKKHCYEVEK